MNSSWRIRWGGGGRWEEIYSRSDRGVGAIASVTRDADVGNGNSAAVRDESASDREGICAAGWGPRHYVAGVIRRDEVRGCKVRPDERVVEEKGDVCELQSGVCDDAFDGEVGGGAGIGVIVRDVVARTEHGIGCDLGKVWTERLLLLNIIRGRVSNSTEQQLD